jgi:hypothetical protein
MKPDLFIVGAPKCGTTAWAEYLGSHPAIFFSPVKEPHYFCSDFPGWQHVKTESDYLDLFAHAGAEPVIGEASVWYLQSEVAAQAIRRFNPESRILIFVRDQADYLRSLHNHAIFNGDECITDFETAWRVSGRRDSSDISATCREPRLLDYRQCGRFSEQVERYFDAVPENQIRVFHFRDWSREPRSTYLEIMRFLGLEDDGRIEFPRINLPKHRRTRWIGPFFRNPPRTLIESAQLLKKLTGRKSLGIARWAREMDTVPGGVNYMGDELRDEIRACFVEDNAKLEQRIWKPAKESRAATARLREPPPKHGAPM